MADNVSITSGSGTLISTEEITTLNGGAVTAQQVQRVIEALRTADGTAVDVPGDTTNGVDVDVTRVPAPLSTTGGGTEAAALRVTLANDSTGVVSVDDNGASLTVDNGGTFATQVDGAALTALQLIDDPVQVLGTDTYTEATSKGMTMGAVRRDADTTLVNTTNEFGPLQMDANGRLKVEVFSGETLPVSGTVTASNTAGDVAHDGGDSGNPVKVGGVAIAHGANPTAVAAADRTNLYANRAGIPFIIGGHPNIVSAEYITTGAQTDDPVVAVVGAGTIIVITQIAVIASAANTVSPAVRIGFGTASVPTQGASGADGVNKVVLSHPGVPAGSGVVKGNGAGIVGIGGDGDDLRITCGAPTTGSLVVQVDYFTIAS